MVYQSGIPTGSVPLNQDYLNIQGNFSSLNTQFNVDHVPLTSTSGTPPNGYHTAIHLVPQGSITNTPSYGQLYSQNITDVNTDQALFWNTGSGNRTVQLTVPIVPTVNANGCTFLPGGLLFQWGAATSGSTVTFPQAFNVGLFAPRVIVTPVGATSSTTTPAVITTTPTSTGFVVQNNGGQTFTFHWMAIGQ